MLLIILFALLMLAGAVVVLFHGGEKENICNYDYKENKKWFWLIVIKTVIVLYSKDI